MVMNIHGQALQARRLPQDDLHRSHRRLAGLKFLLRCAVIRTLSVIVLNLFRLFLVQQNFCNARMIFDGHCQPVCHRLIHRIPINLVAECLICLRNRRAGKAHKGGVRKGLLQDLRIRPGHHRPHILVRVFAEADLSGLFNLRSMRLVRKADDIRAVIDLTDFVLFPVTELLNGADIESSALPRPQLLTQRPAVWNNADLTKIQKLLALCKQPRPLLLQLIPVNNHDNGRGPDFRHIGTAKGQLAGKKRHGIGLAAAGRAKIGAPSAASLAHGVDNALLQKARGKKLRVPADNFMFIAVILTVLKIYVVAENLKESLRTVHPLYHVLQLIKGERGDLVPVVHTAPGIKVLIGGADRPKPRVDPVGNAGQRAIMQQMRNVTPIADIDLLPRVENRSVCIRRIFQLDHAHRHSIDIEKNIRPPVFRLSVIGVLHRKLVDRTENVVLRDLKVDQRNHLSQTVLGGKLNAVHHPAVYLVQGGKIALCARQTDLVHDLANFIRGQSRIGTAQKLLQIIGVQDLSPGTARNTVSRQVLPALSLQKREERVFKVLLTIAAVIIFQFCHCLFNLRPPVIRGSESGRYS